MYAGMWLALLAVLFIGVDGWMEHSRNPNATVTTQQLPDGGHEVVLQRNRLGHYVATGAINGEEVRFMLDTGASDVAIPGPIADELGLQRGRRAIYQTANGTAVAYATTLDRVSLGGIELRNIQASINPRMSEDVGVLLGMSFLRHLEFVQRDGALTLRQNP